MEWREVGELRWLEAELPGARAAFTTRLGGTSQPPFDRLNLGAFVEDEPGAVAENRRRLAAALGIAPERIAYAHQVHGAELLAHRNTPLRCSFAANDEVKAQRKAAGEPTTPLRCSSSTDMAAKEQRKLEVGAGVGAIPAADGHVVSATGLAALVFVADCVPVALSGPGGAAILHCGWRGLASSGRSFDRIAGGNTTAKGRMGSPAPTGRSSSRPAVTNTTAGLIERGVRATGATAAAIGPSIGPCCYEVGDEVLDAFAELDGVASGRMLDLPAVAGELLLRAGVERVEVSGLCTSCEAGLFFSHRRDAGRTGRQAGLVWRTGEEA